MQTSLLQKGNGLNNYILTNSLLHIDVYIYNYYNDLHFRWTEVVGYCKKGFKYYAKTKDMPVMDPRFLPSNRTNDPDRIARYLGVTINYQIKFSIGAN